MIVITNNEKEFEEVNNLGNKFIQAYLLLFQAILILEYED